MPVENVLLSTGPVESKASFLNWAHLLVQMGVKLYATQGTGDFLTMHGMDVTILHWPMEEQTPNVLAYMGEGKIDLVINIPKNFQAAELTNDYQIRRKAVDLNIPLITNLQLAERFVEALSRKDLGDLKVKSWAEYTI